MKTRRFIRIDLLRILFCFGIICGHYASIFRGGYPLGKVFGIFFDQGYLGCEFFFLISGFLTRYTYEDKIENCSVYDFFIGKMKKIYPMYFISVLSGIILELVIRWLRVSTDLDKPISLYYILASIFMVQKGWFINSSNPYGSGTWYLNVLFLCYLIWIIINKAVKDKDNRKVFYLLFFCIGCVCTTNNFELPFLYHDNGRGYMCFFEGCIIYDLYNSVKVRDLTPKISMPCCFFTCLLLISIVVDRAIAGDTSSQFFFGDFRMLCSIFVFPMMLISTVLIPNKSIEIVGAISGFSKYTLSIYLTHAMVMAYIYVILLYYDIKIDFSSLKTFGLIVILCVIVGVVTQWFVDCGSSMWGFRKGKSVS